MTRSSLSQLLLLGSLAGCAGILGIPSDVDREAITEPDSAIPDSSTIEPADGADIDAREGGEIDVDAGPPPPPACDVAKAFGAPVPVDGINTPEDEGSAHLSEDELTIYVDAVRAGNGTGFDIYFAKRPTMTAPFGALQSFPSVDNSFVTTGDDTDPNVTPDGKTIVFERKVPSGDSDLFTATRNSPTDPFGPVSSIANLNTPNFEAEVFLRNDAKNLWHVRNAGVGAGIDISLATFIDGTGYVIEPGTGVVKNLNSPSFEGYPIISKNGLSIYFGSNRPGGPGDIDIYVATRSTPTGDFNTPVLVENVNSPLRDYPGFISGDGCRLYLASKRDGGLGGQDIYVATKPK